MNFKKILSAAITLAMIAGTTMITASAEAVPGELNLDDGSVTITATGYRQGETTVDYTGAYTVNASGETANTITIEENSGEISMAVDNLNISAANSAAIIIKQGATLNLTLNGENTLKSAASYAGISVWAAWDENEDYDPENSGKLVITEESTGSLKAVGGEALPAEGVGGGAGIGGDGCGVFSSSGGDFGVVEIRGGTVDAAGGKAVDAYFGAGAGIGGGGNDARSAGWSYAGRITIFDGVVTATGGAATDNGFCGAAGIGAGSAASDGSTDCNSLPINIEGGTVTAIGSVSAAGIGAGTNGNHGDIIIDGGIVEAIGGDEGNGSEFGGAGIGGGDNGGGSAIMICGYAEVTAKGGGGAAGIGGGNGGYSDTITIKSNARVTAYGGAVGGAGIGTGYFVYGGFGGTDPVIVLNTAGDIVAYGGAGAQAVGFGANPTGDKQPAVTIGENTGKIFMFNKDAVQSAICGLAGNTVDEAALTLEGTNALYWKADDTHAWFKYGGASDSETHEWNANPDNKTFTLRSNGDVIAQCYEFDSDWFTAGSDWAVVQNDTEYLLANLYFVDVTTDADREKGVAKFDLVFEGNSFGMVKNFVSGEFITALTPEASEDGPFEYVLEPYSDEMVFYYDTNPDGTRKYHINLKKFTEEGAENASYTTTDESDSYEKSIHLGKMTVTGYGKGTITISEDESLLMEKHDGTAENLAKAIMTKVGNPAVFDIVPPTCELTVNIKYNNIIENQAKAYQDMRLTISGGELAEDIVYDLGSDAAEAVNWDGSQYTIKVPLMKDTIYNLKVEGAGYRTAYYTVTMNADKTLNFWNNVKDNGDYIETGKESSKVNTNFLAGDLVDDSKINIYDLSAVVSYFGTEIANVADSSEYAKYDLNRDGVIDSKDVAYVLVSWGN